MCAYNINDIAASLDNDVLSSAINTDSTHTHTHTQNQPGPQQSGVIFVGQRPPNKFILSFLALCLCSWCWPALVCAILGIIYSIQVTTQCVSFPIHRGFSLSTNTSIYISCRLSMRDNNGLSKFGKSSFFDKHLHIHTYTQVDNQWTNKDYEGAQQHSIRAQRWSIVALVLGGLGFPLICISIIVLVIAIVTPTYRY